MKTCLSTLARKAERHLRASLVALGLLTTASGLASAATTYWVYQSVGLDTNAGTSAAPFKTIGKAVSVALSGDTIEVRNGTYREAVVLKTGQTLMAAPGNNPIISGMGDLSTPNQVWSTYSGTTFAPAGSVQTTVAPWVARDLYTSFTRQQLSRFPASYSPWAVISSYNKTTHVITLSAPLNVNLSGNVQSSFVYLFLHAAQDYRQYYIASIDSTGQNITLTIPAGETDNQNIAANDTLIIANHPQLIRGGGDWAYLNNGDGTTTLYWDTNLFTYAQSSKLSSVLSIVNVNNVTVKGMEIAGAVQNGVRMTGSTNCSLQSCIVHDNGFGGAFNGVGVDVDTCTNASVVNSIIAGNYNGLGTAGGPGFNLQGCEVAFNDADGVDLAGRTATALSNAVVQNCYLHNNTNLKHPDNLQIYTNVTDLTVKNTFFQVSGQSIMSQECDGVTLTNDVFTATAARNVIIGHGNSRDWDVSNCTFAFGFYGPISVDTVSGAIPDYGTFDIADSVFYRDPLQYTGETSTDYNLFYNRNGANPDDPVGQTYPPFEGASYLTYFTNPIGTQKPLSYLQTFNPNWELHSNIPAGDPAFKNVPLTQAVVTSGLLSSTASQLVLDAHQNMRLTGYFNVGDVVECDADGVARTITAVANVSTAHTTITISPALTNRPFRDVIVWDWPAGTTNLVVDWTPSAGSPALSGSSTGGQRGATLNTVQYQAGSFDGTGTRTIPALTPGVNKVYSINGYSLYPYQGLNP